MARIRTIKPEFFTSDDIVALPPLSRLFYVSLWCEADREGRLEWKPSTFKRRYFPDEKCTVDELCDPLISGGLVVLYEVDGVQYAHIPRFKKHQVINSRESDSVIPAPPDHACSGVNHACSRVNDACVTRESGREGKGREGKEHASRRDDDVCADSGSAVQDHEARTTRIGLLCKRIRQQAQLMNVNPHDPLLIALLDAGYSDDEIFVVCQEAAQKQKPWAWAHTVIQARRRQAESVQKVTPLAPVRSKFAGGI